MIFDKITLWKQWFTETYYMQLPYSRHKLASPPQQDELKAIDISFFKRIESNRSGNLFFVIVFITWMIQNNNRGRADAGEHVRPRVEISGARGAITRDEPESSHQRFFNRILPRTAHRAIQRTRRPPAWPSAPVSWPSQPWRVPQKIIVRSTGPFPSRRRMIALDPSIEQQSDDRDLSRCCDRACDVRRKIKLTREWGDLRRSCPAKKKLKSGHSAGTAGAGSPTGSAVGTKTGDRIGQDRRVGGAPLPATIGAMRRDEGATNGGQGTSSGWPGDLLPPSAWHLGRELAERRLSAPCPSATRRHRVTNGEQKVYSWATLRELLSAMLEEDGLSFAVAEALEISNVMGQQFSGNFVESRKGEMYVFFLRIKFFPRIVISNRLHAFARESFSRSRKIH